MTVTAVRKDASKLTMTVETEFAATPERVWQLWADPRQLERWWGPPTYPATVTTHDLRVGGRVDYHMTGPTGDEPHAFWKVVEVAAPTWLRVTNSLAHPDGTPVDGVPAFDFAVTIAALDAGRARMSIETRFPSTAAMEQFLAMGMEQGLTGAVGQIDEILEDAILSGSNR